MNMLFEAMNTQRILLLLCIMLVPGHITAQELYLSHYTITAGSASVGEIHLTEGSIQSVAIEGLHHDLFGIGAGHKLVVRAALPPDVPWFDVTLVAETTAGQRRATFRLVRDAFIRNKVIAHRGAWKNTKSPENSIAAMEQAIRLGCEGTEFDVHLSADNTPVVNHDAHIQGHSIAKTSAATLAGLKLSNNEPMPTLEQYIAAGMKQNKTRLVLELKPSELGVHRSLVLAQCAVALVEKLRAQAWVDYISFDYNVCKEVKRLAPYAQVSYLEGDKSPEEISRDGLTGIDYHFSIFRKNPAWIADARRYHLTVNTWTVNDKDLMMSFLGQQVDFITTNEPELLLALIK